MKICLVGAGYWGKNYVRLLHSLGKYFEFVGVVEKNQSIIQDLKTNYPYLNLYSDLKDVIDQTDCCIIAAKIVI